MSRKKRLVDPNSATGWVASFTLIVVLVALIPVPASGDPDSEFDNFTIDCGYGKQLQDDPIKKPGEPGHSH